MCEREIRIVEAGGNIPLRTEKSCAVLLITLALFVWAEIYKSVYGRNAIHLSSQNRSLQFLLMNWLFGSVSIHESICNADSDFSSTVYFETNAICRLNRNDEMHHPEYVFHKPVDKWHFKE